MHICIHYPQSAKQITGCVSVGRDTRGEHNMLSMERDTVDIRKIIKLCAHIALAKNTQTQTETHTADPAVSMKMDHSVLQVWLCFTSARSLVCQNTKHALVDLQIHTCAQSFLPSVNSSCGRVPSR